MRTLRLPISLKFFLVLAVLVPLTVALGWVGVRGLTAMNDRVDRLYGDNVRSISAAGDLAGDLASTEARTLELVAARSPRARTDLAAKLSDELVPRVQTRIDALVGTRGNDPSQASAAGVIAARWRAYLRFRQTGALDPRLPRVPTAAGAAALSARVGEIFDPLRAETDRVGRTELAQATMAHESADATYHGGRTLIIVIEVLALLGGAGAVLLLIRNVVPRVREYSRFATGVASGDLAERLTPRGRDELTDLGHALNHMVDRRAAVTRHERSQAEFADTMQVTESEDEAHDLLKHQLERSIEGGGVVVLNRNNSADRLEATTELPEGSPLAETLRSAKPRSCLAVRFARSHEEGPDLNPLLHCEVCGKTEERATCEPLLVGGEVIGSVLVEHPQPLGEEESAAVRDSVSQAAPVLANLRNLAIAEMRAATDSLTGLPNNRAVQDTIKRMVAHASRSVSSLTAVLLDLDHFKQINDSYGHGVGDDVLAAVGSALESSVRESDFVGRYGGEEFVVLMPSADSEGSLVAAEKIRAAIAAITVPGVDRPITASLGVAVLPEHAGEAASLMRSADRALYSAKRQGRNRVELASASPESAAPASALAAPGNGLPAS